MGKRKEPYGNNVPRGKKFKADSNVESKPFTKNAAASTSSPKKEVSLDSIKIRSLEEIRREKEEAKKSTIVDALSSSSQTTSSPSKGNDPNGEKRQYPASLASRLGSASSINGESFLLLSFFLSFCFSSSM